LKNQRVSAVMKCFGTTKRLKRGLIVNGDPILPLSPTYEADDEENDDPDELHQWTKANLHAGT
ncbi:Hypothetical protein FKW44_013492, partial [Caligus rogercresseyi]